MEKILIKPFSRPKTLQVKMSEDEMETIKKIASDKRLTVSDYVRGLIFGFPESYKRMESGNIFFNKDNKK